MGDESIRSDTEAASEAANQVQEGLGEYCSLRMDEIAGSNPVSGSSTHDGLGASIKEAMESWFALLASEAADIKSVSTGLDALDNQLSNKLLGIGG